MVSRAETTGANSVWCAILSRSNLSLIVFFLIGFGIPWTAAIVAKVKHVNFPENTPQFMIAAAFCSGAGIAATYTDGGVLALRKLARRCVLYRVSAIWWLYALLLPPGVHVVATLLYAASGGHLGPLRPMELFHHWWLFYMFVFGMLQGPLAEELGWRGYLLPYLLRLYTPLRASILVGVVWATWHFDVFFRPLQAIALFTASAVALSILMTVLFLHTRGSVLLAIFMHGSGGPGKTIAQLIFPAAKQPPDWLRAAVVVAITLVAVVVTGGKLRFLAVRSD